MTGPTTSRIQLKDGRTLGFALGEIRIRVHLWHGEKDVIVPCAMGRHMAASIPDCQAAFYTGEGHFSVVKNHLNDFLTLLAE